MADRKRVGDYVMDFVLFAGMTATLYFLTKNVLSSFATNLADPEKEKHDQARRKAQANLQRLLKSQQQQNNNGGKGGEAGDGSGDGANGDGSSSSRSARPPPEPLELNEYENMIALEVVPPEDISVGFDDIGGMDEIIEELKESVIYPLTMPQLYSHASPLLSAPSGVLLYGPPGCGKTMLAKALAHESGASFINLHISTLTEKWYGDSNKLVRAVFSLARKLQPAIIFIDEIDAVLGTRRSGEHEASGMVKAEFMTLWDGLMSTNAAGMPSRIVVLGATNRINDIDEAILRRMPKKFPVPLPSIKQRRRILQLVLHQMKLDASLDLDFIAKVTEGMSGSDLKELCRDAAMQPLREYLRAHREAGTPASQVDPANVRGVRTDDFFARLRLDNAATSAMASQGQAMAAALTAAAAAAAASTVSASAASSAATEDSISRRRSSHTRHRRRSTASSRQAVKADSSVAGSEVTDGVKTDDGDEAYEDIEDEPAKTTV